MSFPDYCSDSVQYKYPHGIIPPSQSQCYSNLISYGVHGAVSKINPPTPVTLVPTIFNELGPGHNINYHIPSSKKPCKRQPYVSVNQTHQGVHSEFNKMFYKKRN